MNRDKAQLLLGVFGDLLTCQLQILHIALTTHRPEGHKRERALGRTSVEIDPS